MTPPEPRRLRQLWIGLESPGSGLARVQQAILRELPEGIAQRHLGLVFARTRSSPDEARAGRYQSLQRSRRPWMDTGELAEHLEEFAPDDVIVMGPAMMVGPLLEQLQAYRAQSRLVLYLSVEGEPVHARFAELLHLSDVCIVYSHYVRRRLTELVHAARCANGEAAPPVGVVGHGVDTNVFYPTVGGVTEHFRAGGRSDVRRRLFADRPELHDAFIVLNANRSYYRKRLDLTVEGFAAFARERPDAHLYLHACEISGQDRSSLQAIAARAGIAEKVHVNLLNPNGDPIDESSLNELYNACDVGVNTAMGEGWGLASFEHAATGAPQVVPGHTGFVENWQHAATLLPPVDDIYVFYEFAKMHVISPDDLASALTRLYSDRSFREASAVSAYARATTADLSWASVGKRFVRLLGYNRGLATRAG